MSVQPWGMNSSNLLSISAIVIPKTELMVAMWTNRSLDAQAMSDDYKKLTQTEGNQLSELSN